LLTDAHFHALDLEELDPGWLDFYRASKTLGTASCHSLKEYEHVDGLRARGIPIRVSFGVHPQQPVADELPGIERLAAGRKIDAIGECGFDLYDKNYAGTIDSQASVFSDHIAIAKRYGLPLIIHIRKAMAEIFSRCSELKTVQAVIFHAWPGSPLDAKTLIDRGLNAFFSFGAQAMNGRRLSIKSIKEIPLDRILVESDAPYQKPRDPSNENHSSAKPVNHPSFCRLEDLAPIYSALASIRGTEIEEFTRIIEKNYSIALTPR
jgi:TatD DNase family protein